MVSLAVNDPLAYGSENSTRTLTGGFLRVTGVDVDCGGLERNVHLAGALQVHLSDVSAEVGAERERSTAQPTEVVPALRHLYWADWL